MVLEALSPYSEVWVLCLIHGRLGTTLHGFGTTAGALEILWVQATAGAMLTIHTAGDGMTLMHGTTAGDMDTTLMAMASIPMDGITDGITTTLGQPLATVAQVQEQPQQEQLQERIMEIVDPLNTPQLEVRV